MSNKERLTERWTQGRISEAMLRVYVRKGIIIEGGFRGNLREEILKLQNFKMEDNIWPLIF